MDNLQQPLATESQVTSSPVLEQDANALPDGQQEREQLPEELQSALFDLMRICEKEDEGIRWIHLRKWRRLDLLWNNVVNFFWDESSRDWRVPDWDELNDEDSDTDYAALDRIINIYRPHGEAIVAALSATVPGTLFFPNDADDSDDIDKAAAYSDAADLIQKRLSAQLLLMKALTILFNQGTVFAYNYFKTDKKFGYYRKPVFNDIVKSYFSSYCQHCGDYLGDSEQSLPGTECPNCGMMDLPDSEETQYQDKEFSHYENEEKGCSYIDIFGPLNVKTSFYARSQEFVGYLLLRFDQNVGMLRDIFPELADKITPNVIDSAYDNWSRYSPDYLGSAPENTAIVRCCWFRKWQFELLGSDRRDLIDQLKQEFPNGCYVIFVNDNFAEAVDENLDDHWTITDDPRSSFIHGIPLGENLATIQDIRAEVCELELQTMEHGIPENFIAADAINWDDYGKTRAKPGLTTPVQKEPGKGINENFFQTKTATLSDEIEIIKNHLDQDAQFVSGSFPSIYGGPSTSGSKTAKEYTESKSQALQRLNIVWMIISNFWSKVVGKATEEFIQNMQEDEKIVERQGQAFKNRLISYVDTLKGKVGNIEPENSDQMPLNWGQVRDGIINLITLNNDFVNAALYSPQNSEMIKKATGLTHLYIPGEDDRNKQYREILQLLNSQPIPSQDGQMSPSVQVEEIDDHQVQSNICKVFMLSSRGQYEKTNNPEGYQNIMLHYQMHMMYLQQAPPQETAAPHGHN